MTETGQPSGEVSTDRPRLDSVRVSVIEYDDAVYGKRKYTATIYPERDGGGLYVLYVIRHQWKGNYWRPVERIRWGVAPEAVRTRVAEAVGSDPSDLDPGVQTLTAAREQIRIRQEHVESEDPLTWLRYALERASGDELAVLRETYEELTERREVNEDGT